MATLKTQYETFLKKNPSLNLTLEQWKKKYLIPKLDKIIPTPEDKPKSKNKNNE
jgi:hypothetical protein